ncbi:MAG: site-specific integrase [Polaromonas sp.]|uniref:tyrosine-type recombinase/integrase n=1 Tax=Polaromonas sp. TaxID=1869339 RepID=UPI002730180B|nr:site-specific integrase [Polaromonas sp.]MDP2449086.1 site-specific integrase [Polaromonas sp.]MDP3826491.1 site-specific integrase [Polaromonas sp.]
MRHGKTSSHRRQAGEHLIKATAAYSRVPVRDTALLLILYGTALAVTELATITVGDYLAEDGSVRVTSSIRPSVAHNGEVRPLYWSNKRVVAAIDAYLAWRATHRQGRTIKRDAYHALDPDSPLFLTEDGQPYSLTKRTLPSGVLSHSCNSLGAYISRLHANAGVEGGSAQSAKRTLAVKLHRKGYDLVHIAALLGHKSISTTKRLVSQDPVRLADIVARAI